MQTFSLQYDEPEYEGFVTESVSAPDFAKESIPHNPYRCLECSIPLNKAHHRSQSDISVSNENLAFTNLLNTAGSSSNSLSPIIRSRSHTLESAVSSGESNSTTPHSQSSSKDSPKPSINMGTGQSEPHENGEVKPRDLREAKLRDLKDSMDDKKPKSPLVRMKRVISESGVVIEETTSSKSSGGGGEGPDSKAVSPSTGSAGRDSSSTSGEVSLEGGKGEEGERESGVEEGNTSSSEANGTQGIMINVIGARYFISLCRKCLLDLPDACMHDM